MSYTDFGIQVRQDLMKRNKTLKSLAEDIGCSPGQLSEMLKGTRAFVTRDNDWKLKISEVLGYDQGAGTTTY